VRALDLAPPEAVVNRGYVLVLGLTACVGTIEDEDHQGGTGGAGQATYAARVSSMMRSQCASCHEAAGAGPAFLGGGGAGDDYTALRSNARVLGGFEPASALVLTKGPHAGSTWWSAAQQAAIADWFEQEREGVQGGDTGDLMATWAGCMTIENWNDSKMALWAAKQTDQGNTCGGCHPSGEYGFHASPTSQTMFDQQRTAAGIASFFQVGAGAAGPEVVVSVDKLRNKCSGGNLHPGCAVDDQYVDYLRRFHELTRATLAAGLCDEPGYFDPTAPPPAGP
jgi:hypothetical protein